MDTLMFGIFYTHAPMMSGRVKSTENKYLGSGEKDKVGRRKGSAFFKRDTGDRCWSSAEQLKLAKTGISIYSLTAITKGMS